MKYRNYNTFHLKDLPKRSLAAIAILLLFLVVLIITAGNSIFQNQKRMAEEREAYKAALLANKEPTSLKVTFVSFEKTWNMAMEELIQSFERENPDIDIVYDIIYETGLYEEALNKLYARDELGDVVEVVEPMNYVLNEVMIPLPEEIAEKSAKQFNFNNNTYGVATMGYTSGMIYNKKIFEAYGLEVPTSYEEFLAICETLKENDVTPLVVGGANRWHLAYLLNYYFLYETTNDRGSWMTGLNPNVETSNWSDDVIVNVLTDYKELFDLGYVESLWSRIDSNTAANYLAQGSAAMLYTSTFSIKEVQYQNNNAEIGWFYLPDQNGEPIKDYQSHGYWTMTRSCEDEKKYDAAVRFLEYFYENKNYAKICSAVTGYPMTGGNLEIYDDTLRIAAYGRSAGMGRDEVQDASGDASGDAGEDATGGLGPFAANAVVGNDENQSLTNSTLPQDFRSILFNVVKATLNGEVEAQEAGVMLQARWDGIQEEHVYEDFEP